MKKGCKSLSSILSIFFVGFLTAILVVAVSINSIFTTRAFESSFEEESKVALQNMTNTIKGFQINVKQAGDQMAEDRKLADAAAENNTYTLTSILNSEVSAYSLSYAFLTDIDGKVVVSTAKELDLSGFSKLNHVQAALNDKKNLANEVITGKTLCICYGVPVKKDGEIIGMISVARSLNSTSFLDKLKENTDCEFSVFLGNEQISTTLGKDQKRQIGTKMSSAAAKAVIANRQSHEEKINASGSSLMASYTPILGPDGKSVGAMMAGKNIDQMEKTLNFTLLFSNGIAVLMIIISTIILRLFIRKRIKKPLNEVVTLANNMEHGEISIANADSVVHAEHFGDEVGQVAYALGNTVNSLQMYIGEISGVLSAISTGDLTVETQREYFGDFVEIKNALKNIIDSMNSAFYEISAAAESVSLRSEQISGSAMALSKGSTEQASSIEELSASITEISAQVKENAEYATIAIKNVNQVSSEIEISSKDMNEMVAAMSQIDESSGQIGKIIKTIEDIAFQTNILALNAAVEAARAGAAGKGFAVVADEVRNLASKSSAAAKGTTALIENCVNQVQKGTKIADQTAKSLHQVVESIKVVSDTVDQITQASIQQADSIGQITLGVEQISNVVQTNSATAEESAIASEELSKQAQAMKALVGKFKLLKLTHTDQNPNHSSSLNQQLNSFI